MNKSERATPFILLLLDLVMVVLVFNVAGHFRGVLNGLLLGALVPPAFALVSAIYLIDGYRQRTDMLSVDYASQHAIALISALLATLLYTYVFVSSSYSLQSSRGVIALSFFGLMALTLGYRRLIYQRSRVADSSRHFVFLGDASSSREFREDCLAMSMRQPVIAAVVSPSALSNFSPEERASPPRLFADLLAEIKSGTLSVEAIILRENNRDLTPEISQQLVQLHFQGVPTYTLELFYQVKWQKIPLYRINQTWLFQEGFQIARDPVFERTKRVGDIVLAAVGLVIAAPVVLFAALVIRLGEGGPAFFTQTRIGLNRVPFRIVKLRTMQPGLSNSERYTQPDDARVTRFGRWLRATRIDEFPQLWNVLRGHMSLIGPRAEWDRLVADYERAIPCYHFRHLVKPGITGWAQINYPYGANLDDTLRKLEYDLYYIRHFSFRLDASIVLKTVHVMLFGKGR